MSESTSTKSAVFKEDLALATGGTGAEEEGTRRTSTGGTVTLTKLDASHINFQTLALSLDDLVDGGNDVHIKPSDISMNGTLTNAAMDSAGYVKNNASGVLSGGNAIAATDLPTAIDSAKIANGTVSNTEFQYLNGVTSLIQTQLDAKVTASQADQEAGTEATKYVTPAIQKFHPSAAKAWVFVTGAGTPAIAAGYNIASITDSGAGRFVVVFTTAFSSVNYVMVGTASHLVGTRAYVCEMASDSPPAAASCAVITARTGDSALDDVAYWSAAFFGDQ